MNTYKIFLIITIIGTLFMKYNRSDNFRILFLLHLFCQCHHPFRLCCLLLPERGHSWIFFFNLDFYKIYRFLNFLKNENCGTTVPILMIDFQPHFWYHICENSTRGLNDLQITLKYPTNHWKYSVVTYFKCRNFR